MTRQNDPSPLQQVIQVDHNDHPLGIIEKLEAHRQGTLHRAVSVFLFNSAGEWLLQQRASHKYHCAGLWSNACCTHPYPGESIHAAAQRRLTEEMGVTCELHKVFHFTYRATLDHQLVEYEFDHVFVGYTDAFPSPAPEEVSNWKHISYPALLQDIQASPRQYTPWFRLIYQQIASYQHRLT